ncbi:hypothetical protein N7462_004110 [Penicillium macrosclerotiorum]|uniref:uncharacterized protein n=1 Tax=Penicillium macrosclerotiorum TaxID=303699 RepID=UPI0025470051|nr:uncharacterized protein N7462_004110 [Penicillium macrosclerotiorum]KAJ5689718.1 hypothetical protein N7462_004110 [Penicillium macrosclerotiorum]
MEHCELPSLDSYGIAHHDLGLTLSPGSQSQLSTPWTLDQGDVDLLDFGIGQDFDPFTDFDQLVQQLSGSHKRASDDAFGSGTLSASNKKQHTEDKDYPVAVELPPGLSPKSPVLIPAYESPPAGGGTEPASSVIKNRFPIGSGDMVHQATLEALSQGKSPLEHNSPYGPVGYHPSAPSLHCKTIGEYISNETLHHRLQNSRRRIDVLTIERNRYRDALLKYTSVDPMTGKLGIHLMEAEMATLRRVCSTQQQRAKQYKADIEEWKTNYVTVAKNHNCLIRDYQQLQCASSQSNSPTEERLRSITDDWKGQYEQLSHVYHDLLAAYVHLARDTGTINSPDPSPSSSPSNSPPRLSNPSSLDSQTPTSESLKSVATIATTVPPTHPAECLAKDLANPSPSPTLTCPLTCNLTLEPKMANPVPFGRIPCAPQVTAAQYALILRHYNMPYSAWPYWVRAGIGRNIPPVHLTAPTSGVAFPSTTMTPLTTDTTSSTFNAGPLTVGTSVSTVRTAPFAYGATDSIAGTTTTAIGTSSAFNATRPTVATNVATARMAPSACNATTPVTRMTPPTLDSTCCAVNPSLPTASSTFSTTTDIPTPVSVYAPPALPKDVEVIDLTDDTDAEVSTQSSFQDEIQTPLTTSSSPLTEFRRQFRAKKLSWLTNLEDGEAATRIHEELNPEDDYSGVSIGQCYDFVSTQKLLRHYIGGPFANSTTLHTTDDVRTPIKGNGKCAPRLASKKHSPNKVLKRPRTSTKSSPKTSTKRMTKSNTTQRAEKTSSVSSGHNDNFSPSDEDLARLTEAELAKDSLPTGFSSSLDSNGDYNPSDEDLAQWIDEELAKKSASNDTSHSDVSASIFEDDGN